MGYTDGAAKAPAEFAQVPGETGLAPTGPFGNCVGASGRR